MATFKTLQTLTPMDIYDVLSGFEDGDPAAFKAFAEALRNGEYMQVGVALVDYAEDFCRECNECSGAESPDESIARDARETRQAARDFGRAFPGMGESRDMLDELTILSDAEVALAVREGVAL